jgi:biotin transport system substrate-specific component
MKKITVKEMVKISLVTALLCVLSPLVIPIPISPVPISLSIFVILIGLYAIGAKGGVIACLLYILIGLVGVPVFSGFSAGPGKLFGPTGGYILGYIFICLIAGPIIDKFEKKIWIHVIFMVIGVLVCYAFGTLWFVKVMEGYSFVSALSVCVIPFIPADAIKIAVAAFAGPLIRKQLKRF